MIVKLNEISETERLENTCLAFIKELDKNEFTIKEFIKIYKKMPIIKEWFQWVDLNNIYHCLNSDNNEISEEARILLQMEKIYQTMKYEACYPMKTMILTEASDLLAKKLLKLQGLSFDPNDMIQKDNQGEVDE